MEFERQTKCEEKCGERCDGDRNAEKDVMEIELQRKMWRADTAKY